MEKQINKTVLNLWKNVPVILFFVALSVELVILIIDKSALINPIEGRLFQITFVLFCIKIFFTKYTWREWGALVLFGILGMISYLATDRNELIRIVVFIGACKGINMQKAMAYLFYGTLFGILLLNILSLAGILGDVAKVADYGRGGIETRYTLGIGHPNALHCMFWAIMTLGIYLYHEKLKVHYYLVLFIINILLYLLTLSKTGLLIGVFTLVFSIVINMKLIYRSKKFVSIMSYLIFFSSLVFSIASSITGTNPYLLVKIDGFITNRIMLARYLGGTEYWSLFSSPQNTEYFDMGFVRMIYWYGLIPAFIIMVLLFIMIKKLVKVEDYWALMLVLSFVIYTVVEAHAVSVYIARNYILFLFGSMWTGLLSENIKIKQDTKERYIWKRL